MLDNNLDMTAKLIAGVLITFIAWLLFGGSFPRKRG